jgi:hypothetical protein
VSAPEAEGHVIAGCIVGLILAAFLWGAIAWLVRVLFFAR